MADLKVSMPTDEADALLGMLGMPLTAQNGPNLSPMMVPGTAPAQASSGPLPVIPGARQSVSPGASTSTALPGIGATNASGTPRALPSISDMGEPVAPNPLTAPTTSAGVPYGSSAWARNVMAQHEAQQAQPRRGGVLGAIEKIGGWGASILTPHVAAMIPSTPLGRITQENTDLARVAALQKQEQEAQRAQSEEELQQAQTGEARANTLKALRQPPQRQGLTPAETTLRDLMTGDNGQPRINPQTGRPYTQLEAYEAVNRAKQNAKPTRFSDPFEAYAYGDPQERQAAQDFISFEKQIGARYEKPNEVDQRYALYKRDPQAYKAMYGNRGGAQDEAQAARMLNYFNRRRQEIQNDWTLTPQEQQQRLAEIDQLEEPFLNAAGPSAGESVAGGSDRVTVIAPDGRHGTIPRSQLKAAQRKGYRLAQ